MSVLSAIPKTLLSFFGVGVGGVMPLAYIATNGFQFGSTVKTPKILIEQTSWECQVKEFDETDLKRVVHNAPFFKKIHCYKDGLYDWQIFLPNSIVEGVGLDDSKSLNLISEKKENNISPIKILQEGKAITRDWIIMKHTNSYSVAGKVEENLKYPNLHEFEIVGFDAQEKAWVKL